MTIASEDDELISEWCELLQDVCKGKRVREVHSGWVEKKNAMSERWKSVFLLLLSTHELLVMQSEQAAQPKHVLQLADLAAVRSIDKYADDGYDHAFELVMGGEEPYTVEYCVDDAELREQWVLGRRDARADTRSAGRCARHHSDAESAGPPRRGPRDCSTKAVKLRKKEASTICAPIASPSSEGMTTRIVRKGSSSP